MMYNEQKLIDIMFQIGLMIHNNSYFKNKTNEEVCAWIRSQLEQCGFETMPLGSSWGILKEVKNAK